MCANDYESAGGSHVNPTTLELESAFREQVRDLLDLSHLTRDDQLFDELRRLKEVERCYKITEEEARAQGARNAAAFRVTEGQ